VRPIRPGDPSEKVGCLASLSTLFCLWYHPWGLLDDLFVRGVLSSSEVSPLQVSSEDPSVSRTDSRTDKDLLSFL
jgi:hypothetical protein